VDYPHDYQIHDGLRYSSGMNDSTPVGEVPQLLLDSSAYLLTRLGRIAKSEATAKCAAEGLDLPHIGVLALLEERPPATQAAIADALGIDRSQLVGELDELEELGLVERHRDTVDRRRQLVSLTPAGRKRIQTFRRTAAQIEDEFLAPLGEKERAALHALLLELARHHDRRFAGDRLANVS
jgi:DNA-binding MarR family transcriptional regulator